MASLLPRPPRGSPIKDLERAWLRSAVAYEVFGESPYSDHDWDSFAAELYARRQEWSPYFLQCVPSPEFNTGTTASGVDWSGSGVARLFLEEARGLYGV